MRQWMGTSRSWLKIAAVALMAIGLAGCGRSESYRYKLTLAVETPDGIKQGSSVVDVMFYDVSFPERGTMHTLHGEALYLDLGPGKRPLIALLTRQLRDASMRRGEYMRDFEERVRWNRDAGPGTRWLCQLYGFAPSEDYMDDVPRIARMRGAREIAPTDLPDLVTFADVNDPKTVIEVDPNDLEATLGPGVAWNKVTLESTDEPVTKGIEQKLTWLPGYFQNNLLLDGTDTGDFRITPRPLKNKLGWPDFVSFVWKRKH